MRSTYGWAKTVDVDLEIGDGTFFSSLQHRGLSV